METNKNLLKYLYEETAIHFLVHPKEENVMVNATEMAKLFNKKTELFLKSDHAKAFIEVANRQPNGGQIIDNRGRNGIFFNKRLALKFAAWLSPEFEYWIYSTIEKITFGYYKEHWDAHIKQEEAKEQMEALEKVLKIAPTKELFLEYLACQRTIKKTQAVKNKAIKNQYKMNL